MSQLNRQSASRGVIRAYMVAVRANPGKAESARYAIWWSQRWCLDYVRQLYNEKPSATVSTAGMGKLNNDAQKTARDILRAGRAAAKATGAVFQCPQTAPAYVTAILRPARRSESFEWWATVPRCPPIPLQPHRAFSRALRAGAQVTTQCQVRMGKRGGLVARVCVEFPKTTPVESPDIIGADVGVNVGVATSDGRCSRSLRIVMDRHRTRNAERRRQKHRCKSARTALKQELDREAKRIVTLAKRTGRSIAIERLKTLGNLKPSGSIGGWARVHLGTRVLQIAEVVGVAVTQEHPAYSSQMHWKCGGRGHRRGVEFECDQCGSREHADVNAARNLVRKARGVFRWPERQKGRETNMVAFAGTLSSDGASLVSDSFPYLSEV